MNTLNNLAHAVRLAVTLHAGQLDGQGLPYVYHPIRVAESVRERSIDCRIVAYLHDTVEDTEYTLEDAEKHFGSYVRFMLDALSRRRVGQTDEESYPDFISRVLVAGEDVRAIKKADVRDNLDRLDGIADPDKRIRLENKYITALKRLQRGE